MVTPCKITSYELAATNPQACSDAHPKLAAATFWAGGDMKKISTQGLVNMNWLVGSQKCVWYWFLQGIGAASMLLALLAGGAGPEKGPKCYKIGCSSCISWVQRCWKVRNKTCTSVIALKNQGHTLQDHQLWACGNQTASLRPCTP